MRNFIDLISPLLETIVARPRDGGYMVAINPSKVEWTTNFPKGAAGVFCQNGDLVVGDGSCLAHDLLLDLASVDQAQEKFRLQLGPQRGYAELWLDEEYTEQSDQMTDEAQKAAFINQSIIERYGADLKTISGQITAAAQRMLPGYVVRAIAMSFDQEGLLPGDEEWRSSCW